MQLSRDRSADGFSRRIRRFLLGNFKPFWRLVEKAPALHKLASRKLIGTAVKVSRTRPHPFSTLSDHTSWRSLTDRSYFGRHLPPKSTVSEEPPIDEIVGLFKRPAEGAEDCPKSTLLFSVFAQYLTDGFLRTDMDDRARTTSNHQIDLSPLYGRNEDQTNVLTDPNARGRLKSQDFHGEELPLFLYTDDGVIDPQFCDADGSPILDMPLGIDRVEPKDRPGNIFAIGGDRANATPMVAAMNTLFLREHNRIADELAARRTDWSGDRVFDVSRNITTAIYIKLVIEEFINHISSACLPLLADQSVAWNSTWNKPNWMTIEFALLYRWHPSIPDALKIGDKVRSAGAMVLNNKAFLERGQLGLFQDMSTNWAKKLTLFNTPDFLSDTERRAIQQSRDLKVPYFNDYREAMSLPRLTSFEQMTGDPIKLKELKRLYTSVDQVGFYEGLFAEDVAENTPMPPLMGAMVAVDAFSQALVNPLLSEHVFNADTFSEEGMSLIQSTTCLSDIVLRNSITKEPPPLITMTRPDWTRERTPF